MKLGKEEIQKIVLGLLLAVGVVYGYFDWLLLPMQARHANIAKSITALEPEIGRARAQLSRDADVQRQAPIAAATLAQIDAMIPEGAPVAWFPTLISDFFKARKIERVNTRMTGEAPHPTLTGYRKIFWTIEFPKVDFVTFGRALSAFENEQPLIAVDNITVESQRVEPDAQRVVISVFNIVKQ